jgi:hypothetical protein
VLLLISVFLTPAAVTAQHPLAGERTDFHGKVDAIRASADKLSKVQQIPWVTDVFEGFRLATEEQRPVFLYMITGDPLGDC